MSENITVKSNIKVTMAALESQAEKSLDGKEYIDSRLDFILGQLESLSSNEVYEEFKKLI